MPAGLLEAIGWTPALYTYSRAQDDLFASERCLAVPPSTARGGIRVIRWPTKAIVRRPGASSC